MSTRMSMASQRIHWITKCHVLKPKGEYPGWVSPIERDILFWTSDTEGVALLAKTIAACSFGAAIVAGKLGGPSLLHAMEGLRMRGGDAMRLASDCHRLLASFARVSLLQIFFLIFLLAWDLYKCPTTLALASACLRDGDFVHMLVVLMWGTMGRHSLGIKSFTSVGWHHLGEAKQRSIAIRRWLGVIFMTCGLSVPSVLLQVGQAVPGAIGGMKWVEGVKIACVGAFQGFLSAVVAPRLAQKLTSRRKDVYTTITNLLTTCIYPLAVIIFLDTECFGYWVSLWEPCRHHAQQFRLSLGCRAPSFSCSMVDHPGQMLTAAVLHPTDICDPYRSRGKTTSRCVDLSLLRLQGLWLRKLVTSGLLIPAGRIATGLGYSSSAEVLGKLAVLIAYGTIAAGHLPLIVSLLCLATLFEALVALASWKNGQLKCEEDNQGVVAPSLFMAQVSAALLQVTSASGSPVALVLIIVIVYRQSCTWVRLWMPTSA